MTGSEPVVRTRPKDRKQQILLVARDLFVELGYHQVTMRLIADKLGIGAERCTGTTRTRPSCSMPSSGTALPTSLRRPRRTDRWTVSWRTASRP